MTLCILLTTHLSGCEMDRADIHQPSLTDMYELSLCYQVTGFVLSKAAHAS